MRANFALAFLLALQAASHVAPEPQHFRYQRTIQLPAGTQGRVCAPLDPAVYQHSTALTDLRLYTAGAELPYALMTSQADARSESAQVLNAGQVRNANQRGPAIAFDLAMPARPYSTVDLQLSGRDFLATAKVTGLHHPGSCCTSGTQLGTQLGTFTLFDLTTQRLGRSTTIALGESTFPYLHIELEARPAPGRSTFQATPGMVLGASIPPSREAQTLYTPVAQTTSILQQPRQSVATFQLPAHVPIERVSFALDPASTTSFSRTVRLKAVVAAPPNAPPILPEELAGEISRIHLTEKGQDIREQNLSIPAILGSNVRDPATLTITVENGDDQPIPLHAIRLEMRQRLLCFDAPSTPAAPSAPITMLYGDPALAAPVYDYARLFRPADHAEAATLGPEQPNAHFAPRHQSRTFTDRHPELLSVALFAVVCALGLVAFRSTKRR
jgi:hypothetical protein